jgi:hypothetical protein
MIDELKRIWKDAIAAVFRHYPSIFLEVQNKITKALSQYNLYPDRDSNPTPLPLNEHARRVQQIFLRQYSTSAACHLLTRWFAEPISSTLKMEAISSPLKRRLKLNGLHGVISQKMILSGITLP